MPEDIARYKGTYISGWDTLRQRRYEKLIATGLIKKEWLLSSKLTKIPAWNSLSDTEKDRQDTRMAIYAVMIDRMDSEIGRVLDKLKALQQEDNTLILFLSDNGGSADDVKNWDYVIQKSGTPGSVASIDSYEIPWGTVSNTPFRGFKKNTHEGGISTPFIAYFPGVIKAGTVNRQVAHVIDILPTCLSVAGITYPATFHQRTLTPLAGTSLQNAFHNKPFKDHSNLCWEHEGSRAVRQGKWKLVAEKGDVWELYDMEHDRSETHNIAGQYPVKVAELQQVYQAWAAKVGVVDLP